MSQIIKGKGTLRNAENRQRVICGKSGAERSANYPLSGSLNRSTAQTTEPIFMHNMSKEPAWDKENTFGG